MRTVFYSPAPYPNDEEQRQSVVSRLLALDLDDPALHEAVAEVAALFGVPVAALTILDGDRQWLAVRHGIAAATTSRSSAFCGYTIGDHTPFVVPDAAEDPRFAGNPLVLGEPHIRFYAGSPLIVSGMPIGALCALAPEPIHGVDTGRLERLQALASQVSATLQRLAADAAPRPAEAGASADVRRLSVRRPDDV